MTKKPKRRWETTPFSDLLKPVPKLPDATTLRETGLPLTEDQLQLVRTAMAVYTASRQPQLTWEGWKLVGAAVEIGTYHAEKLNRGPITGRNPPLTSFLRATGFTFINKAVRSVLRQCMGSLEDIEAWRKDLDQNDRVHLNNPIDVWDRFNKDGRPLLPATLRNRKRGEHRDMPTALDQIEAMADQVAHLEEALALYADVISGLLDKLEPDERLDQLTSVPDDLLRKLFPALPDDIQIALHARLYKAAEGGILEP